MEDLQLMRNNCYEYNCTRNPHLLPVVDGVIAIFEEQLKEHEADLIKYEEALQSATTSTIRHLIDI